MYHQAVSPALQGALYGPTQHDVQAIEDWAQSEGLTVGALSPNRTTLELHATVATAEAAFHTRLSNYTLGSHTRLAAEAEPQIPSEFTPVIAGIGGLVEEDAQPLFTGSQGNHFITPADFATIYDVNRGTQPEWVIVRSHQHCFDHCSCVTHAFGHGRAEPFSRRSWSGTLCMRADIRRVQAT